jgi:hypothetical protein
VVSGSIPMDRSEPFARLLDELSDGGIGEGLSVAKSPTGSYPPSTLAGRILGLEEKNSLLPNQEDAGGRSRSRVAPGRARAHELGSRGHRQSNNLE